MLERLAARVESGCLARQRRTATRRSASKAEERIELESGVVRVVRRGSASRVVVMVPDPPNVAEHHDVLIRELARDHTVYCVEMAGFGQSFLRPGLSYDLDNHCALLRSLFERLQIRDVTLSIACLSGLVGMSFAARNPGLVARLVLLQVPSLGEARRWIRHVDVMGAIRTPVVGQLFMHAFRNKVVDQWYRSALPEPLDEELYERMRSLAAGALQAGGGFALGSAYQGLRGAAAELPRDLPQLHIWGTADGTHRRSNTQRRALIEEMESARLVELPECGHFADLERPKIYCDLLRGFEAESGVSAGKLPARGELEP